MAKRQKKSAGSTCAATHVAFLRGINVGGKNRLPMGELLTFFEKVGCAQVRTYIQSGNVLFAADDACAARVPGLVEEQIENRYGFRSPLIVRTVKEMERIVERNPFKDAGDALYVGFLSTKPATGAIASLDQNRSPGDTYEVIGREVYMNLAANGAARTKLTTAYFDSKLATISTFRNWRTTTTILHMMRAAP